MAGQQAHATSAAATTAKVPARCRKAATCSFRLNGNICKLADNGNIWDLLNLMGEHHSRLTLVNISTCMHRLARLTKDGHVGLAREPQVLALLARVRELLKEGRTERADFLTLPRCLSTIMWACARLQISDTSLFLLLTETAVIVVEGFKPFELTNLLWACAKLNFSNESLLRRAQSHISGCLTEFPKECLAMIVWSFATLQYRPAVGLMSKAVSQFISRNSSRTVSAVEVENLSWGLASMQVSPDANVMEAVGDIACKILHSFKVHELCITLWSFARLRIVHPALFHAAAQLIMSSPTLRQALYSQGLSNFMWAFAKNGELDLFAAVRPMLLERCKEILPEIKPQELSSIFWSLAHTGYFWGSCQQTDSFFVEAANGPLGSPVYLSQMQLSVASNLLESAGLCLGDVEQAGWYQGMLLRLVHCCASSAGLDSKAALVCLQALPSPAFTHGQQEVYHLAVVIVAAVGKDMNLFGMKELALVAAQSGKMQGELRELLSCLVATAVLKADLAQCTIDQLHAFENMCGPALLCASRGLAEALQLLANGNAPKDPQAPSARSQAPMYICRVDSLSKSTRLSPFDFGSGSTTASVTDLERRDGLTLSCSPFVRD